MLSGSEEDEESATAHSSFFSVFAPPSAPAGSRAGVVGSGLVFPSANSGTNAAAPPFHPTQSRTLTMLGLQDP